MMAEALADRIAELRLALNSIRAAIAAGATIDLLGFDTGVARVLAEAEAAPPQERETLLAELEKLLEEIDAVGLELRLHRDSEAARRAASAYTRRNSR
ncbi:MAG TPA: hypothetical protein VKV32_18580 [Stellaceae bacterium]|nr:hypothetical protein [Stellaceae bacterium]